MLKVLVILTVISASQLMVEAVDYEKVAAEMTKTLTLIETALKTMGEKITAGDKGAGDDAKKVIDPFLAEVKKLLTSAIDEAKAKKSTVESAKAMLDGIRKQFATLIAALNEGPLKKLKAEAMKEVQAMLNGAVEESAKSEKTIMDLLK